MTLAALGFPVLKFFPAEPAGWRALAQRRGRAVARHPVLPDRRRQRR
jgi:hypothetical protein